MRFEDEQYVRLYKRDTTTWLMLPWQSRCLLPLMLKAADRAGIIDLGSDGYEGLAVTLKVPLDLVEAAMPEILKRRIVLLRPDGVLVWPKYIEAQEAKQSDKARQKSARDRARDLALAAERGVDVAASPPSIPPEPVPPSTNEPSHGVTVPSHGVTVASHEAPIPNGTVTNRSEVNRSEMKRPAEGVQGAAPKRAEGSAPPPPILVVQEPEAPRARKRGRLPQTYMREDWKPKPEHAEYVRVNGLDLDVLVEDFRNHWLAEGKLGANWDARFKQNVDRVMRTDWLVEKFAARQPVAREQPRPVAATEPDGPFVPPTPEARAAMAKLKLPARGDFAAEAAAADAERGSDVRIRRLGPAVPVPEAAVAGGKGR